MKVLFLTSEGFDTPNSINHLITTLIEDILESEISVHTISSHKTGEYDDIPQSLMKYNNFSFDIIKRKNIDKNNFVKRYIDEINYAFKAKKIWSKKIDLFDSVIIQSNPNSVINAFLLNRYMKKPIVLNLYDVFPGHAMSVGVIKSKLLFKIFDFLQQILYRQCEYIVVMSEDMKKQVVKKNISEHKTIVVNNWFDDSLFKTIDRKNNKFFNKYKLDTNKFYVQFAGLLGYVFNYKMFLDVANNLQNHDNIVFLLIGDGNQKDIILDEIKRRQLTNIKYFPWQPLDIIADVYNACDVGFIPLKQGVIGNGIPSKACQLMAAKRVVLNSVEESTYTKVFDENNIGINVTNFSPKVASDIIVELSNDPKKCHLIGENAFNYAYEHYSRTKNTKKFIQLLNTLKK